MQIKRGAQSIVKCQPFYNTMGRGACVHFDTLVKSIAQHIVLIHAEDSAFDNATIIECCCKY